MGLLITIAAFVLFALICTCIDIITKYKEGRNAIGKLPKFKKDIENLTTKNNILSKEINDLRKINFILTKETNPFRQTASCIADLQTLNYKSEENFLKYKKRSAYKAAEVVSDLRKTTKNAIQKEREATYKLETIISLFPELETYIYNKDELVELCKFNSSEDLKKNYDCARDYLSKEEYSQLTPVERNQLALDRYIEKRNKSNWAIGRDYEMSCAYILEKEGYFVEMNGILNKFGDLGRDIIAHREFKNNLFDWDSKFEILVIQCKYWSNKREIHENVIMQLYGTYIAYRIEQEQQGYMRFINKITPVLMIPSFSVLSETAKRFVETLDIKLVIQDMVEFPRIKCNINGTNKIYHLPFDQQYDNTQIKNKGEFYAFSVKEAEEKGFRRAMRHFVN